MSDFHPIEVVGRGSETQLQVGENLNKLTQWDKEDNNNAKSICEANIILCTYGLCHYYYLVHSLVFVLFRNATMLLL